MTVDVFLDKKRLKGENGESRFWSLTHTHTPNLGKVLLSTKCCWFVVLDTIHKIVGSAESNELQVILIY